MGILKKYNIDIILLAIIAGVLLLGNIVIAIPRELSDINRHELVPLSQQVNHSRLDAKQIQSALAQYYADYDDYPDEKKFNKAITQMIGKMPSYNKRKMVRKYKKVVNANGKNNSYEIYFYDNPPTESVNESKFILTDGTNTYNLFK